MYNSILQFHELGVKKLEKIVRNYCANPNQDIGDFIMVLDEELKKLQRNIISETIEIILQERKNG